MVTQLTLCLRQDWNSQSPGDPSPKCLARRQAGRLTKELDVEQIDSSQGEMLGWGEAT